MKFWLTVATLPPVMTDGRAPHVPLIEDNPGARLIREMLAEEPDTPFDISCVDRLAHGLTS